MDSNSSSASPLRGGSALGKLAKFGLPLLISVGLCITLFRDIDIPEMMRIIREDCDFSIIALTMLLGLVPVVIRALRWGIQLRAIDVRPPFRVLFYAIFGTYSFNIIFPRLGEVWRCGYISYRQDAPFSEVFGSMLADRMADTVCVLLLTFATFLFASSPFIKFVETYPELYNKLAALITSPLFWIAGIAFVGGIWALLRYGRGRFFDRVRSFFRGIWDGFAAIARMDGKGRWLVLTALLWCFYFLQLYVAFYAFPMTRRMLADNGFIVALICYMLSALAMGIPSNGGIGPYQTAIIFGLQIFAPAAVTATEQAQREFITAGAAFGNTVLAAQTFVWIVGGIIVFLLIAADKRRTRKE